MMPHYMTREIDKALGMGMEARHTKRGIYTFDNYNAAMIFLQHRQQGYPEPQHPSGTVILHFREEENCDKWKCDVETIEYGIVDGEPQVIKNITKDYQGPLDLLKWSRLGFNVTSVTERLSEN